MSDLPMYLEKEEEWSQMFLLYDAAIKEISTKLEILNNEFKLSHQYNPIEHVTSRLKSMNSIARKLRKRNLELTVANVMQSLNDVAGLRVICSFSSDIYRIANAIERQSDIKILKIKDYIKEPKPNGYMSYHMIVSIPIFLSDRVIETKIEIQIRTIAMDFWASLEHKIYYKFEGNAPQGIRAELKECANIVAFLDKKMLSINEYVKEYSEKGSVSHMTVDTGDYDVIDVEENADVVKDTVDKVKNIDESTSDKNVKSENKNQKKRRLWR